MDSGLLIFLAVIGFFVIRFVWRLIYGAGNQTPRGLDILATRGIRARGLVLTCSPNVVGVTLSMRRYEKRNMTIDVDVPGRPPYQSTGLYLVPRGLIEIIPGASLDLAVDPKNPNTIAVLGPGGFTGPWLRMGPPQPF